MFKLGDTLRLVKLPGSGPRGDYAVGELYVVSGTIPGLNVDHLEPYQNWLWAIPKDGVLTDSLAIIREDKSKTCWYGHFELANDAKEEKRYKDIPWL